MKKHYITSLKGIGCFFVALGHFLGTIKYASSIPLNTKWLSFLKHLQLDFLINESFWLYIFFIASGYLLGRSKVEKLTDFFIRCITRILRLALPILSACFFIFLLSKIIPFYGNYTSILFENSFLQSAFSQKFFFIDVILSPIHVLLFGNSIFNSPYWVLRSMLLASFLIYFITYINSKIKPRIVRTLFHLSIIAISVFNLIIFSCVLGSLLYYYEDRFKAIFKSMITVSLCGLFSFSICFFNDTVGAIFFFSWLIISIPQLSTIRNVIERKPLRYLGEISFGIYSFHWPLFCSVGSLLIIKLWNAGHGFALFTSMIISMVATITLSIIFHHTLEKHCGQIVDWTKKFLNLLFSVQQNSPKQHP